MNKKAAILIACHKPAEVYHDDIYIPIHVGRAISNYKKEMADMIGDDTGDNISAKNPYYSELTAQYWAWKNLKDVEYVGLCHYRRYFETKYTEESLDKIFAKYDVILPEPMYHLLNHGGMLGKLREHLMPEDCAIFYLVIRKLYPEYEKSVLKYLCHNVDIAYNMLITKKEIFDKFCEWQFSILAECEKHVKQAPYSRYRRIYGYLGEFLLPIYCLHNGLKIHYDPIVPMIGEKAVRTNFFRKILSRYINGRTYPSFDYLILKAVRLGLANDGISI